MTRIPPTLSYLTIYNPTLRPNELSIEDEDAEERAHILFFTSKDRAVSMDRMLRQVGLGKALVNFVEQFSAGDPCSSVHSQARRMVMVAPEPHFWIHACVDVARIARVPVKGKEKAKVDKGKLETAIQYDYEDGSVHDGAVRAHIMKGYESFKLTHGSFASILNSHGQHALELQLERFWTVWAWSWDLEESPEFGETLGPRLHPYFSSLIPLLDDYAAKVSTSIAPILLSRVQIIPSSRFTEGRHPSALSTYLSSMIPASSAGRFGINVLAASVETIKGGIPTEVKGAPSLTKTPNPGGNSFLGMPALTVKMDMRKWNWPGYLTFGKGASNKPSIENLSMNIERERDEEGHNTISSNHGEQELNQVETSLHSDDLQDATNTSGSMSPRHVSIEEFPNSMDGNDAIYDEPLDETPSLTPPLPEFTLKRLHLASEGSSNTTKRVSIQHLVHNGYMLALVQPDGEFDSESQSLQYAAENAMKLFDDIESTICSLDLRVSSTITSPERQDQFLISSGQYSFAGTTGFTSNSSHLFNAKAILENNPKLSEVFSRGQNPQHWHVAKRGFGGTSSLNGVGTNDEVFMEVFRKEASLTDVDNVLLASVRKSGILDGYENLRR